MRTGYVQQSGGLLTLTTPLGANALLLDEMDGVEGISELFKFNLYMRAGSTTLNASQIIGKSVTVAFAAEGATTRYINGIVSRFSQSGGNIDFAQYQAEVVPALWTLTLSRDRKIYQSQSVSDIVKAVLGEFSITFSSKLTGTYSALDYVVQYDETAFEFISRLMEQAGIFYFFTFTSGTHTMVLADGNSAFLACTGSSAMTFLNASTTVNQINIVSRFEQEHRLVMKTSTVSDYAFATPSTSLQGTYSATAGTGEGYVFPAGNSTAAQGKSFATIRVQASQVDAEIMRGDSFAFGFSAGTKFTLSNHFVTALNTSYVLRRIRHSVGQGTYRNEFEAFPATVTYRPPLITPKPRAIGSDTALVVGSSGEEIWSNSNGAIKVLFHWDRLGKPNDTASPWIRVSQTLAGKGFGTLFLPRVGQEVVITYINGDPERPLVTGCVYNGENTTPLKLPTNQTQSTIMTWSSKDGTAGNQIMFEDKKGSESFYLHAQKDMTVLIENGLTTTLTSGNESRTLTAGNLTVNLKKGNESHTVAGTRTLSITGNETQTNSGNFSHTVDGNYSLTVKGNLNLSVTGGITISSEGAVTISAGTSMTAKAGTAMTVQAGTSLTNTAGTTLTDQAGTNLTSKACVNMTVQAGAQLNVAGAMITSKADTTHTVQGGAMLTLKGAMTSIN
jgi:type VI secretion system secreted protein VgrG